MGIKYPILVAVLLVCAYCSQDVPVEPRSYGFSVGDPYGTLHIQFFLDLLCTYAASQAPIPRHPMAPG